MGWDLSLHHLMVLSKAQGKKGFFQVAEPREKSTFKPLGLNTASVSPRHTEPLSSGLSLALKGLFPDNGTVLSLSCIYLPFISSSASSLVRVIFSCLHDEGLLDWLCFTKRCEHRTLLGSPWPFFPLPLGRSHWLALVMWLK